MQTCNATFNTWTRWVHNKTHFISYDQLVRRRLALRWFDRERANVRISLLRSRPMFFLSLAPRPLLLFFSHFNSGRLLYLSSLFSNTFAGLKLYYEQIISSSRCFWNLLAPGVTPLNTNTRLLKAVSYTGSDSNDIFSRQINYMKRDTNGTSLIQFVKLVSSYYFF